MGLWGDRGDGLEWTGGACLPLSGGASLEGRPGSEMTAVREGGREGRTRLRARYCRPGRPVGRRGSSLWHGEVQGRPRRPLRRGWTRPTTTPPRPPPPRPPPALAPSRLSAMWPSRLLAGRCIATRSAGRVAATADRRRQHITALHPSPNFHHTEDTPTLYQRVATTVLICNLQAPRSAASHSARPSARQYAARHLRHSL